VTPFAGFLLAAVFGILSFPPIGLWPLAHVAMVPFLLAAAQTKRPVFWRAYAAGFVFYGGLLYWLGLNSGAPPVLTWSSVIAVVAILATVWGIAAAVVARTARRFDVVWAAVVFVILYVFLEVFWGTGELGFPWAIWAVTQTGFLPAIQMADAGDVYLISAWVLSVNALVFLLIYRRESKPRTAMLLAVVLIVPLAYGLGRMKSLRSDESVSVAAVQGNTPVGEKWQISAEEIVEKYLTLTRSLKTTDVALAVWPETAAPIPLRFRPWTTDQIQTWVDSSGIALFTGATDYAESPTAERMAPYNAGFLFRPQMRELLTTAKVHLVPFGERIPGQRWFPSLGRLHLGQAEFAAAKAPKVLPASGRIPAFGSLICFEVVFPDIAADLALHGARFLANITEDGWYGNSSGPYQHLALTRLRAVAVRRAIVRAANTGISAIILPSGEVMQKLNYDHTGVVIGALPLRTGVTLAARLARLWLPIYTALLVIVWLCLRVASWHKDKVQRSA
jgi:apolipoprotein N-acyltransferase